MTHFKKITEKDIKELVPFAEKIWKEHYYTCVDKGLTDYVFELFLSEAAIKQQLDEGSNYYYVYTDESDERAGYFSFYPKDGRMFLSKIYLEKEFRGKGISSDVLDFIKTEARKEDLHEIFLHVNRDNTGSIEAYKHLGFYVEEEIDTDMGDGFVSRDYVMGMQI